MKNIELYIINEPGDIFEIHEDFRIAAPILWNKDGKFRIIPLPVLQNIIDLLIMYRKTLGNVTYPKTTIVWAQGIEISNQAGRALINE